MPTRIARRSFLPAGIAAAMLAVVAADARTIRLEPPATCGPDEPFVSVANSLKPGDELVLAPGVYCQTGRRLVAVSGTPERPIVIRGEGPGRPVLTRPGRPAERHRYDNAEFRGAHLVIRNLHFRGGKRGLAFLGGSHHVTLEGSEISGTSNNGIALNDGDTSAFVIRRNHIHHTGNLDRALGHTEGEGIYVGCNRAACIAHGHLIEGNTIHDLRANGSGGNDGIEIKYGSYGNVVRNNVIHTVFPALEDVRYPCIFAYGTLARHRHRPNVIEDNLMWGCGEAIQVVADAVVRNNLILGSDRGLATYYHEQVPVQRNLRIENNVFVGARVDLQFGVQAGFTDPPAAADGSPADGSPGHGSGGGRRPGPPPKPAPQGIVFAGNAVYGPGPAPLLTVDFPLGGDIAVTGNTLGDLSPAALVVGRDPGGAIRPGSFVAAGRPGAGLSRPAP